MGTIQDTMKHILERCDIRMEGNTISKELLLTTFCDFISSTMENKSHNVGIVLHTGSVCFDAILFAYAAVTDILYNQTDTNDVISSLIPGDTVLYYTSQKANAKVQRCVFRGFVNSPDEVEASSSRRMGYMVLEIGKGDKAYKNFISKQSWARVVPYFGDSDAMDGRGLRRDNGKRSEFFKSILNVEDNEIPRLIDTSTVIVMSRDEADRLVNGLSFRFDNTDMRLTELVPVSYFTDRDHEYPYGGNSAKAEPVIKICGRVSVARSLLLKRNGNRNIGLIVLGDEVYRRGESEMPELLSRQSIQYIYVCTHVDSVYSSKLVEENESAALFACTKDFLLSNSLPTTVPNPLTVQLHQQTDTIIDREVITKRISGVIEWKEYKTFKDLVFFIKSSDFESSEKDDFVIQSYSLMNLFLTAVFSMRELEEYIEEGKIDRVERPDLRLTAIRKYVSALPEYLKEAAEAATEILEQTYLKLYDASPKEGALIRIITDNPGKSIAPVVPKAYYSVIINDMVSRNFPNRTDDIVPVSVNRFDNSNLYDLVVAVGNISGSRFDVLRCRSASAVNVLLYDAEQYPYKKKARKAKAAEHALNLRSTIVTDDEYREEIFGIDEAEIEDVEKIDEEINQFVNESVIRAVKNGSAYAGSKSTTDIIAVARFSSGEVSFFTKNYEAYVLDEGENSVKTSAVKELCEDDTIVFTRSNSKTRDIVESLLQDTIHDRSLFSVEEEEAYLTAGRWKTALVDFMRITRMTAGELADKMIRNGVGVQEATIKAWLDEDSHTVIPQKPDSIRQIALITEDEELFDGAERVFGAGKKVYKIRRRILRAIGQAILGRLSGQKDYDDPLVDAVSERIGDAAVILRIDRIDFVSDTVPMNLINRPIDMD